MKKYYRKPNLNIAKYSWIILTILLLATSCNLSSKKQYKNIDELSEKVQDVKGELNEVIVAEKNGLKSEVDSVVADFDNKIAKTESYIEKGEKKLNSEAEEMLKELKAKRDSLSMKADKIEQQTEKDWETFRNELKHDTKQFVSSMKDFFKDNA
jgi:uncharacterized protein (DUF3084 family)